MDPNSEIHIPVPRVLMTPTLNFSYYYSPFLKYAFYALQVQSAISIATMDMLFFGRSLRNKEMRS